MWPCLAVNLCFPRPRYTLLFLSLRFLVCSSLLVKIFLSVPTLSQEVCGKCNVPYDVPDEVPGGAVCVVSRSTYDREETETSPQERHLSSLPEFPIWGEFVYVVLLTNILLFWALLSFVYFQLFPWLYRHYAKFQILLMYIRGVTGNFIRLYLHCANFQILLRFMMLPQTLLYSISTMQSFKSYSCTWCYCKPY